jgi:hypothetical protein
MILCVGEDAEKSGYSARILCCQKKKQRAIDGNNGIIDEEKENIR